MALNDNFKEEYYLALKDGLDTALANHNYLAVLHRYDALKCEINEILKFSGSFCSDIETCIDKNTTTLKAGAESVLASEELKEKVKVLLSVLAKLNEYKDKYGWDDELTCHLMTVLALGKYRDFEKDIIKQFGWEKGQRIIYDVKTKVLEYEKQIGADFFRQDVEILCDVLRTDCLYETDKILSVASASNKKSQAITFANADGETFKCTKSAQLNYRGETYFEIVLPIDLRCKKYNYYKLENTAVGRKFILEQEEEKIKKLDKLYDSLPDEF